MTIATLVVAAVLIAFSILSTAVLIDRADKRHQTERTQERLRAAAEREQYWQQYKFLNDRYLAKHSSEAITMDRMALRSEMEMDDRRERDHVPLPEGLTGNLPG